MKCNKPFGLICVVFTFCAVTTASASTTAEGCCGRCVGGRVLKILSSTSLQAVNGLDLRPGDRVLFERGGVWRGQLLPKSGEPGRPIVYGAFGEGKKPVIEPSYAKNAVADWTDVGDGLWRAESGAKEDIGNIIFDHGVAGCAFLFERNVFSRSKDTLMRLFNDWRKSMTFRDNIWRADGETLCRYHGRPVKGLKYLYPMRLDRAHDDNQAEIESQPVNSPRVFASNQLAEFMDFLNADEDAAHTPDDCRQGP